jgi:hypothetical protein
METQLDNVHDALTLHRVCDPDRDALLRILGKLSNSRDYRRFPGSNPCSLERANFPALTQQLYYICDKTDGIRFLWFCTEYNGLNVSCIVDRAMNVYVLPLEAIPTAMFQGSIVDCELAFNTAEKQWHLLAFDVYVVSGIPVFYMPFSQRMSALQRAMAVYVPGTKDPLPVRVKRFIPTTMFASYMAMEASARTYGVDGVILTPETSPAVIGRHTELFKLKTRHTVDFLVGMSGSDACVYDAASGSHIAVARLRHPEAPGSIVECSRGADGVWDIACVRRDKKTANDKLTFDKTQLNMAENITLDELQRVFANILS